jgi:hypothetical protein
MENRDFHFARPGSVQLFTVARTYWQILLSHAFRFRSLCRMFNRATRGHSPPTYLSSDHDRLYEFHQWHANLRIQDMAEIKTVPYAPRSHPFVERLIGTIRRECLDRTLFWTAADLEVKLQEFQRYYNGYRAHAGLHGRPPASIPDEGAARASLGSYRWQPHCRGLYHTPVAA